MVNEEKDKFHSTSTFKTEEMILFPMYMVGRIFQSLKNKNSSGGVCLIAGGGRDRRFGGVAYTPSNNRQKNKTGKIRH